MDASRPSAAGLPSGTDSPPVVLKGRFDITPNTLADPIGSPRALAHGARDRLNGERGIFALVCDPDLPPNALALDRMTTEISYLKSFGFNDPKRTEEYGRQISAGFTGLLAFAAIIFSCFLAW